MTDDQDGATSGDEPEPRPRRRTHRRASSSATAGHPDAGHWSHPAEERSGGEGAETRESEATDRPGIRRVAGKDSDAGPESAQDRWWREQRPPHYE